jgi:glycosyltransferase involved in cell wall biosynthesis
MKIAYIGGAYVPSRAANSMHQMAMCEALAEHGHDVTLHVRPGPETAADDYAFYGTKPNFKIEKHRRPSLRGVGALVNAALVAQSVARGPRPDLIYARELHGLALCTPLGLPFAFEAHWIPLGQADRHYRGWLFSRRQFRRAVFISEALRELYLDLYPKLSREQTLVAHDAANVPPRTPTRALRPNPRLQVGYVGGFLAGYGIEVVEALARRRPDLDFHVVGGSDQAVADWRARTAGVANLELHGFVPPSTLPQVYAELDIVLAPYQRETAHIDWISPMKLFEYMAHAKPLICSDFPVMREIVINEETGLLLPPDSLEAWSNALSRLADPGLRARLGQSARARLEAKFTWSARSALVLDGLG